MVPGEGPRVGAVAEAQLACLADSLEGLPLGLLEAMGRGCVPVVTDIRSGIPDLVQDGVNGFRVPVGGIQQFAARLATLQRDPLLRWEMGLRAYHTVSAGGYRIEDSVRSYLALFRRVLEQNERGTYRRPKGRVLPPPSVSWHEHLPGTVQMLGDYGKRLLGMDKE